MGRGHGEAEIKRHSEKWIGHRNFSEGIVRFRVRTIAVSVIVSALAFGVGAQTLHPANAAAEPKRAMTFADLAAMERVSQPQLSPDGQWIAYEVGKPDMDANRVTHNIWIVPTAGGEVRQLTRGGSDQRPRWSPDGRRIAFVSAREGTPQVYVVAPEGGDAMRLSSLSTGADNELWSPDGKWIAFVSSVYSACSDDACDEKRDEAAAKDKVKAHVYEKLLYRHWTAWWDGKRSHLFVMLANGDDHAAHDLTPGADYDVPPFNLGNPEAIAFSPDSQEICFTANTDKDEALSTNGDLFVVPTSGAIRPLRITKNPGNDWGPVYSPDGRWIAYRAQFQAGYESDRWRLMVYDRAHAKSANLTEKFDRGIDEMAWSADSKTVFFTAENEAEQPVYSIRVGSSGEAAAAPQMAVRDGFNAEIGISSDGRKMVFTRQSLTAPSEIFLANADGTDARQVTHHNAARLAQLDLAPGEPIWFEGAAKTKVEGLIVRPPNFDASKKYPVLLLIHGGPQGAWSDAWSYRWNAEMFAAPGYVVLMINPRGSTGYGQKFTEEITTDWGGKVYDDLTKGLDAAIAKYPFIDSSRVGAAGASYGGFMIDWIATHTGRFKVLVSHAGAWDAVAMWGATEELWFQEWEYGGTPWDSPALYKKWSPSEFAAALGKFKTPTLVTGGELDFRIPYTQDLEFFGALQRQGVPSKLVIFPNQGHWILKPQDSQFWYSTVLDWLARYLK